jgi:hypothetical protein
MRTLLLTKYMWKMITFHCLPSLRCQVPLEHLHVILDAICTKYIVLRRCLKIYEYKSQIVTYYQCHSGGNKVRPHRKTWSIKPFDGKGSRKERRSRLCDYVFQVNTIQPRYMRRQVKHSKTEEKLPFLSTPSILGMNLALMLIVFSYMCILRLYLGPPRT